jgi:hypothetical protein
MHKLLQLKKNQCFGLKGSSVINTYKTHRITSQTIQVYLIVTALYKFILWWYWYSKASFFPPSWWVTIQLVKLMSLTDYSSVPLSFTHINNKKNQWITRPHNIQKSLNKTNISICITTTSCLPPIWSSRPALLLTGCGFLRMTRAQYHAQESEYENTPPCIRGSGMLLSQLPLIHSQPYELLPTCVLTDGNMFQNRRVSSPAPVTMVCKLHLTILAALLNEIDSSFWVHR